MKMSKKMYMGGGMSPEYAEGGKIKMVAKRAEELKKFAKGAKGAKMAMALKKMMKK